MVPCAIASQMSDGMEQIREQQARSNHSKDGTPVKTVARFAELRLKVRRMRALVETAGGDDGAPVADGLVATHQDLVFGLMSTFEEFADLFPRADQLGRCLGHTRCVAEQTRNPDVRREIHALREHLESLTILAKVSDQERTQLGQLGQHVDRLMKQHAPSGHDREGICMIILWLRTASALEAMRGYDDLPELDARWWISVESADPEEIFNVKTAVRRMYKSRS